MQNIDLHALTGWIPERISISSDPDRLRTFKMLLSKTEVGHVLVTVATGEIPEKEADRAGLVPTHAYALLDVRVVKGVKLFLLKNPWSHLRWKGNYSELDTVHWTEDMKSQLNYNPNSSNSHPPAHRFELTRWKQLEVKKGKADRRASSKKLLETL